MMKIETIIGGLEQLQWHCGLIYGAVIDEAIKYLATYDQIKWERDIAIEQLKQLGYSLGEQPREPDSDLISRQVAIDAVVSLCNDCDSGYCGSCRVNYPGEKDARKALEGLPSAKMDGIRKE